jgi:sugar lactone lactonase YvrE
MKSFVIVLLLTTVFCAPVFGRELVVELVAGTGAAENNGDSGPAVSINVGEPFGVEVGPDGALYIAEVHNHRIRRLDLKSKTLTTVAGRGHRGHSGDGAPAVEAELNEPYEIRFDKDGNMFFVEMKNHIIRRVDGKTKKISTIAGTGRPGFGGDGGAATEAQFNQPHSIALDGKGGLYVADIGNHRIRRIDLKSGVIESIAGNSQRRLPQEGQVARGNPILGPRALFVAGGTMWIALREGHSVWRMNLGDGILHHVAGTGKAGYTGDDGQAAAAQLNGPKGIAVVTNGDVFVADTENNAIRRIDAKSGKITTAAGGSATVKARASNRDTPSIAKFNRPHGICAAPDGSLYIGDTMNHRVWRVH